MTSTHPLAITDAEAPWLGFGHPEDLDRIRTDIINAGHSAAVAAGVVGFLLSREYGTPDGLSSATRSRYRKILRDLDGGYYDDPADRHQGDAGTITLAAAGTITLAATGALALTPIIFVL